MNGDQSGFAAALGVQLGGIEEGRISLRLPFRPENANPGDALHGGCAAALGLIGGRLVTASALGPGRIVTVSAHVSYLAAAIGEEVIATTTLTRKGKEMCFAGTQVETADGKAIAQVTTVIRAEGSASAPVPLPEAAGDDGSADPGPMGPFVGSMPFTNARRLSVEHMAGGTSRLTMPLITANAGFDGAFHEGAALALLDTTGAMAAWGLTGPGPFKASTAALQAQMLGVADATALTGFGRVVHRAGDLFWVDVDLAGRDDRRLFGRGTVIYRIVT